MVIVMQIKVKHVVILPLIVLAKLEKDAIQHPINVKLIVAMESVKPTRKEFANLIVIGAEMVLAIQVKKRAVKIVNLIAEFVKARK